MKKISNSFFSVIIGIILIIAGIILIFWNEKNNVKNIAMIDELNEVAIDISSTNIDSSNDNKLVAVSGKLELNGNLNDNIFGVKVLTAKLVRTVEMYQWSESCSSDSNNNKNCTYSKTWNSTIIDSTKFEQSGYNNPTYMSYESSTSVAASAKLGDFNITNEQLKSLSADTKYNNFSFLPSGYKQNGSYVTNSSDLNNPEIGDIRISFTYNNSENISVLAKQNGNNLVDYETEDGKLINHVSSGIKNASQIINEIENGNNILKWILRAVGLLLEIIGFSALFSLITTITSYVPILGSLVGTATSVIGFILGSIVTLVCTAIAWIVYRPIIGIILLIVSGVLLYALIKKGKR